MVEAIHRRERLEELVSQSHLAVLHFRTQWCEASKQMDAVCQQLCMEADARFLQVDAEEHPDISQKYQVVAVPYFVFIKGGEVVDTLEGADPAELAKKVEKLTGDSATTFQNGTKSEVLEEKKAGSRISEELKAKLEKLLKSSPVMLFMKGTADVPRCGFSRNVVNVLKQEGVKFETFDILADEEVRQGLKTYSNWPTYPQLYYKGELLGGCDVILEMEKSGELAEVLADARKAAEKEDDHDAGLAGKW